jgi:hypothetical protein
MKDVQLVVIDSKQLYASVMHSSIRIEGEKSHKFLVLQYGEGPSERRDRLKTKLARMEVEMGISASEVRLLAYQFF